MMRYLRAFAMAAPLLVAVAAEPALAQKSGGILKMFSPDSPASISIHEEATWVGAKPGFYNLAREVNRNLPEEAASNAGSMRCAAQPKEGFNDHGASAEAR